MPAKDQDYFVTLRNDECMLWDHGLDSWPETNDLTRFVCDLENGLRALASALDVDLAKDYRGRWSVTPREYSLETNHG